VGHFFLVSLLQSAHVLSHGSGRASDRSLGTIVHQMAAVRKEASYFEITQGVILATHPSLPDFLVRENAPDVVGKLAELVEPPI
jgi:hypothetical protein